jgi:hypothetical protein
METGLKVDFHSLQNVAGSIFYDRFLSKCVQSTTAIEICLRLTVCISKESDRKKSIAQHFAVNGNPPLRPVLYVEFWARRMQFKQ